MVQIAINSNQLRPRKIDKWERGGGEVEDDIHILRDGLAQRAIPNDPTVGPRSFMDGDSDVNLNNLWINCRIRRKLKSNGTTT